ncbi:MAG: alanine--tRNA ligase [Treponema sp.]|nr:alanine--tRNA ligase [Treponema sp.]MCL2236698.1 alanine--tRNA ligase [Treponema sp.]
MKRLTADELRGKYVNFFVSKGHTQIQGKSLIPENDPTALFTMAGMHPLVPYLSGQEHPAGKRLTDFQKCIRTSDIDSVGDPSHLTFFEMLGNWSLGDYFKEETIKMSFEFLTSPDWLNIPLDKLGVTVFEGEDGIPKDDESASIWKSLGVTRISYLPREDNWWGPAGTTGPCGPDTEMFYYMGDAPCSADCKPGCPCNKWLEIWNDVFMQYNKNASGEYEPLSRKCVDTGMGIERTVTVLNGKSSVYDTEIFADILGAIEKASGVSYKSGAAGETDKSIRIIADHVRSSTFILGDPKAVSPSNVGAGYVLRRLIRRAVRHGRKLSANEMRLSPIAEVVINQFKEAYPELKENSGFILKELDKEEDKFMETLQKGEHEFEKLLPNLLKDPRKIMSGRLAFKLYDTYGFPIELTEELAAESGMTVNREEFEDAFKKHQELSRSQSGQAFKGGLGDQGEEAVKYHTATHLLHKALKIVLGDHVAQKGSNITAERLRFDFANDAPMTSAQIKAVEDIVNDQIRKNLPVSMETMGIDEAKASGAIALFGEKYEAQVKVYTIGASSSDFFTKEVCGGPHVERTGVLGSFKIQKEQSSSAGVRRIRAVLEP